MYVYIRIRSETAGEDAQGSWDDLWTVGFYDPAGKWHPERDCTTEGEAAERVAWLNGGRRSNSTAEVSQ